MDPWLTAWRDELLGPPEEGTCEGCFEETTVYRVRNWRIIRDQAPRSSVVQLCRWCLKLPPDEEGPSPQGR